MLQSVQNNEDLKIDEAYELCVSMSLTYPGMVIACRPMNHEVREKVIVGPMNQGPKLHACQRAIKVTFDTGKFYSINTPRIVARLQH